MHEVTTGTDDITLEVTRTDNQTDVTVLTTANESYMSIIRLGDDWDYFDATSDSSGVAYLDTTPDNVDWEVQNNYDTGSFTHSTVTNPEQITLKTAGYYLVMFSADVDNNTDTRDVAEFYLTLDGSEIDATRASSYTRNTETCATSHVQLTALVKTTGSAVLRVAGTAEQSDATDMEYDRDRTHIQIVALPSDTQTNAVKVHDSAGADPTDGDSAAPQDMDTNNYVDSDFAHSESVNPSRVTVNTTGDYLWIGHMRVEDATANARDDIVTRWAINGGAASGIGLGSSYTRGTSPGTAGAHVNIGVQLDMTATDYIELETTDEGTAAGSSQTTADRVGIDGIRIGSMFDDPPTGGDVAKNSRHNMIGT